MWWAGGIWWRRLRIDGGMPSLPSPRRSMEMRGLVQFLTYFGVSRFLGYARNDMVEWLV